jgi:hypothetical protein
MSNNGNYNDTTTIPFLLRNYFPVRHTAPVLVGDMLGLTGTIIPNSSTYSLGASDYPFNEMYLSGSINLTGNSTVGDFITGPTGSIGFNLDGSLYSSNGVTTNLINLVGPSGNTYSNITLYQESNILFYADQDGVITQLGGVTGGTVSKDDVRNEVEFTLAKIAN